MNDMLRLAPWNEHDVLDIPTLTARLAAGADVNQPLPESKWNYYPLGVAAYHGNVEACRLLLAAGAQLGRGSHGERSPLIAAIEGRFSTLAGVGMRRFSSETLVEIVDVLVKSGANPDGIKFGSVSTTARWTEYEHSPLFMAIVRDDLDAAKVFLKSGANINLPALPKGSALSKYKSEVHPLQFASDKGRHEMVAFLIHAGADDACLVGGGEDGETPFQVCVRRGHVAAVECYVRERGEDIAQRIGNRSMSQWARDAEMKALLNSLKTELAVQSTLADDQSPKCPVSPRKAAGMVL